MTWTRFPGLNPARSSQRPIRRIFGIVAPFQKSPSASIFSMRTVGSGVVGFNDLFSRTTPPFRRGTHINVRTASARGSKAQLQTVNYRVHPQNRRP